MKRIISSNGVIRIRILLKGGPYDGQDVFAGEAAVLSGCYMNNGYIYWASSMTPEDQIPTFVHGPNIAGKCSSVACPNAPCKPDVAILIDHDDSLNSRRHWCYR